MSILVVVGEERAVEVALVTRNGLRRDRLERGLPDSRKIALERRKESAPYPIGGEGLLRHEGS